MLQLADRPKMLGNTEVIGATMVSVQKKALATRSFQLIGLRWDLVGLIDSIR